MIYRILFFASIILTYTNSQAQNYRIDFKAAGERDSISNILVENLTKNTSLSLTSDNYLKLVSSLTGNQELMDDNSQPVRVFPNPVMGEGLMELRINIRSAVKITVYNIAGQSVAKYVNTLNSGQHRFSIHGLGNGIYIYQIISETERYSGKIISKSNGSAAVTLTLLNSEDISGLTKASEKVMEKSLKIEATEVKMVYTDGDILKFTGISGKYASIRTAVPTQYDTITFTFLKCADADSNYYPVVQIGSQYWMAENLKTTTLNDSTPLIEPSEEDFENERRPAYIWFNESAYSYKNVYGALYNGEAMITNKLCPVGWHVPSNSEWAALETYLGGPLVAGGKLKETGKTHWISPNYGATNASGFTARPGGDHCLDFSGLGSNGYWWTSTPYYEDYYYRNLGSWTNEFMTFDCGTYVGNSVRCIKD